ncbi:MAG: LPS export ABC transporter periplasmic protein LptC [Armatimonadetes bacterium]|nr:LPS export ABC transporter periplasmic protein LptC [Armatimonadota bacterium]
MRKRCIPIFSRHFFFAALFLLLLFSAPIAAQEAKKMTIDADHLTYNEKTKLYRIWGKVRMTQDEIVVTTKEASYDARKQVAFMTGGVTITQPGTVVTADKGTIYLNQKKTVLSGNVRAIYDRSNETGKSPGRPSGRSGGARFREAGRTVLTANDLEYFWAKKDGTARGDVRVVQADKTATSDTASYFGKDDIIVLESNVQLTRAPKDVLNCDKVTMHIRTDLVEAEGNVRGRFEVKESP